VGNELSPAAPLVLDVFPSASRTAEFVVYDDDGHTYEYESGNYFRQEVTAKRAGSATEVDLGAATGKYHAHFPTYLMLVHQASKAVASNGSAMKRFASESAFRGSEEPGWVSTTDKFGAATMVRLPVEAGARKLTLTAN
jgi:alpha-glucosidase